MQDVCMGARGDEISTWRALLWVSKERKLQLGRGNSELKMSEIGRMSTGCIVHSGLVPIVFQGCACACMCVHGRWFFAFLIVFWGYFISPSSSSLHFPYRKKIELNLCVQSSWTEELQTIITEKHWHISRPQQ